MKIKNRDGEWKPVELGIEISISGKVAEEVFSLAKLFQDYVSETLADKYPLLLTGIETKQQILPEPNNIKKIIFISKS